MGRSPCPATTAESSAAGAETRSDNEEDERQEYAERHAECRLVFRRYGFYVFKFCTSYGDEDY
jgi:hypothetical protein